MKVPFLSTTILTERRGLGVLTAWIVALLGLSPDALDAQSHDAFRKDIAAVSAIATDLGLQEFNSLGITIAQEIEQSEAIVTRLSSDVLAFQDGLCTLLRGPRPPVEESGAISCDISELLVDGLGDRLTDHRKELDRIAEDSAKAYEAALVWEAADLARLAREGAVAESEGAIEELEAWWQDSGLKALLAIERIGREYIEVSVRDASAKLKENARAHVLSRLEATLEREEVAVAVAHLVEQGDARFRPLQDVANDPDGALRAAADMAQFLQDRIAARLKDELAKAGATAAADFIAAFGEDLSITDIVATLEEQRQAFERVLQVAENLPEESCIFVGLGASRLTGIGPASAVPEDQRRAAVEDDRIRAAMNRFSGFVDRCVDESVSGLRDVLASVTPSGPDPIQIAQSLCRNARALTGASKTILVESLVGAALSEADARALAAVDDRFCGVIRQLPSEFSQLERWLDLVPVDPVLTPEEKARLTQVITALDGGAMEALRSALSRRAFEYWLMEAVFAANEMATLTDPGNPAIEGCAPASADQDPSETRLPTIDFALGAPRAELRGENLFLVADAELRLCRTEPMVIANDEDAKLSEDDAKRLLFRFLPLPAASAGLEIDITDLASDLADVSKTLLSTPIDKIDETTISAVTDALRDDLQNSFAAQKTVEWDTEKLNSETLSEVILFVIESVLGPNAGEAALERKLALSRILKSLETTVTVLEETRSLKVEGSVPFVGDEIEICTTVRIEGAVVEDNDCPDLISEPDKLVEKIAARAVIILQTELATALTAELEAVLAEGEAAAADALAVARSVAANAGIALLPNGAELILTAGTGDAPGQFDTALLDDLPGDLVKGSDIAGTFRVFVPYDTPKKTEVRSSFTLDTGAIVARLIDGIGGTDLIETIESVLTRRNCVGLRFSEDAFLQGTLGSACLENGRITFIPGDDRQPIRIVPFETNVEMTIFGDSLEETIELTLHLEDAVIERDADILRGVRDLTMTLHIPSATGELLEGQNPILFGNVNRRIATKLPVGISVRSVSFGADGLAIETDPDLSDGAFALAMLDTPEIRVAALKHLGLPDPSACETRSVGIALAMISERKPSDSLRAALAKHAEECGGINRVNRVLGLNYWASFPASGAETLIRWQCVGPSPAEIVADVDTELESCTVLFPAFEAPCDDVKLTVSDTAEWTNLDACIADQIGRLLPDPRLVNALERRLAQTQKLMDVFCDLDETGLPASLADCRIQGQVEVPLQEVFDEVRDALAAEDQPDIFCGKPVLLPVTVDLIFGFDGRLTAGESGIADLDAALRSFAESELLCRGSSLFAKLEDLLQSVSEVLGDEWGNAANVECDAVAGEEYRCKTLIDNHKELIGEVTEVRLTRRNIDILGQSVAIQAALKPLSEGGFGSPKLTILCPSCEQGLNALADDLVHGFADRTQFLTYRRGSARLAISASQAQLDAPLTVSIEDLGVEVPVPLSCKLDLKRPETASCRAARIEPLILEAIRRAIEANLNTTPYDFGMFTLRFSEVATEDDKRITLVGRVSLPEFGIEDVGRLAVVLPVLGGTLVTKFEPTGEDALKAHLIGYLNDLIGAGVPITITDANIVQDDKGRPRSIEISSAASIGDWFKISVPNVIVGENGLAVVGPNELTIGFPPGAQIPVTPFTICPTGGTVGEERLVIYASITAAECTASAMINIRGSAEIGFKDVELAVRGNLVLLAFLQLGNAEAVLDLKEPSFQSDLEIGGVLSDVISYQSRMKASSNPPEATTLDELQLFRVPVQKQEVHIKFARDGEIKATMKFNLFGFLNADGSFKSDVDFRRPEGKFGGNAKVGGWTLAGVDAQARPDLLRAGFTVLGLRIGVIVPGLDAFTPDYLKKLIENLLTPDFENLDKALEAIFSGNITINPIADFGNGGEGFGDGDANGDNANPGDNNGQSSGEPGPEGDGDQQGEATAVSEAEAPQVADAEKVGEPRPLLNPPGGMSVVFEKDGGAVSAVLKEGGETVSVIARIASEPTATRALINPIVEGEGTPLVFTRSSYMHRWFAKPGEGVVAPQCKAGIPTPAVFSFSGGAEGVVGYAELCRFGAGADAYLQPVHAPVVVPFLEALSRAPDAYPPLIPLNPETGEPQPLGARRLLEIGRFLELDGLQAIALLGPGRVLVTTSLPDRQDPEANTCTASLEGAADPSVRTFIIYDQAADTSTFEAWTETDLQQILSGLSACGSSVVSVTRRTDVGGIGFGEDGRSAWLGARGNLSAWTGSGWTLIRLRPPEQEIEVNPNEILSAAEAAEELIGPPPSVPLPGPVPPDDAEKLVQEEQVEDALPTILPAGGGPTLRFVRNDETGKCEVRRDASVLAEYVTSLFGGDSCYTEGRSLVVSAHFAGPQSRFNILVLPEDEGGSTQLVHIGRGDGLSEPLGTWPLTSTAQVALDRLVALNDFEEAIALHVSGFDEAGDMAALTLQKGGKGHIVWASGAQEGQAEISVPEFFTEDHFKALPYALRDVRSDLERWLGISAGPSSDKINVAKFRGNEEAIFIRRVREDRSRFSLVGLKLEDGAWRRLGVVFGDRGPFPDSYGEYIGQLAASDDESLLPFEVWLAKHEDTAHILAVARDKIWVTVRVEQLGEPGDPVAANKLLDQYFGTVENSRPISGECYISEDFVIPADAKNSVKYARRPYKDRLDCVDAFRKADVRHSDAAVQRALEDALAIVGDAEPEEDVTISETLEITGAVALARDPVCAAKMGPIFAALALDPPKTKLRVVPLREDCLSDRSLMLAEVEGDAITSLFEPLDGGVVPRAVFDGNALPLDYRADFMRIFGLPDADEEPVVFRSFVFEPGLVASRHWAAQVKGQDVLTLLHGEPRRTRALRIEGLAPGEDGGAVSAVIATALATDETATFHVVRRTDDSLALLIDPVLGGEQRLVIVPLGAENGFRVATVTPEGLDRLTGRERSLAQAAMLLEQSGQTLDIGALNDVSGWSNFGLRVSADLLAADLFVDLPHEAEELGAVPDRQSVQVLVGADAAGSLRRLSVCGDRLPLAIAGTALSETGGLVAGDTALAVPCSARFEAAESRGNAGLLISEGDDKSLSVMSLPCPEGTCAEAVKKSAPVEDDVLRKLLVGRLSSLLPADESEGEGAIELRFDGEIEVTEVGLTDAGDAVDETTRTRTLLYTWTGGAAIESNNRVLSRHRLLVAVGDGLSRRCVSGPIGVILASNSDEEINEIAAVSGLSAGEWSTVARTLAKRAVTNCAEPGGLALRIIRAEDGSFSTYIGPEPEDLGMLFPVPDRAPLRRADRAHPFLIRATFQTAPHWPSVGGSVRLRPAQPEQVSFRQHTEIGTGRQVRLPAGLSEAEVTRLLDLVRRVTPPDDTSTVSFNDIGEGILVAALDGQQRVVFRKATGSAVIINYGFGSPPEGALTRFMEELADPGQVRMVPRFALTDEVALDLETGHVTQFPGNRRLGTLPGAYLDASNSMTGEILQQVGMAGVPFDLCGSDGLVLLAFSASPDCDEPGLHLRWFAFTSQGWLPILSALDPDEEDFKPMIHQGGALLQDETKILFLSRSGATGPAAHAAARVCGTGRIEIPARSVTVGLGAGAGSIELDLMADPCVPAIGLHGLVTQLNGIPSEKIFQEASRLVAEDAENSRLLVAVTDRVLDIVLTASAPRDLALQVISQMSDNGIAGCILNNDPSSPLKVLAVRAAAPDADGLVSKSALFRKAGGAENCNSLAVVPDLHAPPLERLARRLIATPQSPCKVVATSPDQGLLHCETSQGHHLAAAAGRPNAFDVVAAPTVDLKDFPEAALQGVTIRDEFTRIVFARPDADETHLFWMIDAEIDHIDIHRGAAVSAAGIDFGHGIPMEGDIARLSAGLSELGDVADDGDVATLHVASDTLAWMCQEKATFYVLVASDGTAERLLAINAESMPVTCSSDFGRVTPILSEAATQASRPTHIVHEGSDVLAATRQGAGDFVLHLVSPWQTDCTSLLEGDASRALVRLVLDLREACEESWEVKDTGAAAIVSADLDLHVLRGSCRSVFHPLPGATGPADRLEPGLDTESVLHPEPCDPALIAGAWVDLGGQIALATGEAIASSVSRADASFHDDPWKAALTDRAAWALGDLEDRAQKIVVGAVSVDVTISQGSPEKTLVVTRQGCVGGLGVSPDRIRVRATRDCDAIIAVLDDPRRTGDTFEGHLTTLTGGPLPVAECLEKMAGLGALNDCVSGIAVFAKDGAPHTSDTALAGRGSTEDLAGLFQQAASDHHAWDMLSELGFINPGRTTFLDWHTRRYLIETQGDVRTNLFQSKCRIPRGDLEEALFAALSTRPAGSLTDDETRDHLEMIVAAHKDAGPDLLPANPAWFQLRFNRNPTAILRKYGVCDRIM